MLLLVSLLLSLGLAEIAVRRFCSTPRYPYIVVANDKVGFLMRPGFVGRASNMFGDYDSAIQINKEGFRDTDHPLAKSDKRRIAFLGDSFTFAEQVEESESFARRVETLLNQKRAGNLPSVEVMNFGIGGYDIPQYVQCYEAFVSKYRPDAVVVAVYVDNDLLNSAFYLLEHGFGRPYFRLKDGKLEEMPADLAQLEANYKKYQKRLRLRWYHHSHLYNRQKLVLWNIRQKFNLRSAQKNNPALSVDKLWKKSGYRNYRYYAQGLHDPIVAEADAVTRLLLQRLQADVEKDGGCLYIALLPAPENLHPEIWPERIKSLPGLEKFPMDFDRPFKEVSLALPDLAKRRDIFDTRPALRKAAKQGPIFYPVDCHYNQRGQEAVAQEIAEQLEPRVYSKSRQD